MLADDISVILPFRNEAPYLKACLQSLVRQRDVRFELVAVDDGSTDNTNDIILSYGELVRYLHQENKGAASARNAGIEASDGELIAFLDSDDYFTLENLEIKVLFLESHPAITWVYSDWQYVNPEGKELGKGSSKFNYAEKQLVGNIFEELVRSRNFISPCTVVVRKSTLEDIGHFDPQIPSQEEYDLWLRISLKYPVYYIDEVLVGVTLHPTSLSRNFTKWVQGNAIIADKLKDLIPYNFKDRQKVVDRIIADKHTFLGRDFFQKGQLNEAINAFWQSIKHLPLQKRVYWLMFVTIFRSIWGYLLPDTISEQSKR